MIRFSSIHWNRWSNPILLNNINISLSVPVICRMGQSQQIGSSLIEDELRFSQLFLGTHMYQSAMAPKWGQKHQCFSSPIRTLTGCGSSLSTSPDEGRVPLSRWECAIKSTNSTTQKYWCHQGTTSTSYSKRDKVLIFTRIKGVFLWNLRNVLLPVLVEQSTGCEGGSAEVEGVPASKQLHCSYSWHTTCTLLQNHLHLTASNHCKARGTLECGIQLAGVFRTGCRRESEHWRLPSLAFHHHHRRRSQRII